MEWKDGKVVSTLSEWKTAVPHPEEPKILCVVIGNSSYSWSMLQSKNDDFVATLFWRTPCITAKETKSISSFQLLANLLPNVIHDEVFGNEGQADKAHALQHAAARKSPCLSVYIVSTNKENERGLAYAFSDIPNRIFRIENTDFFSRENGCYDTFGVDRAACLYSGFKLGRFPLLVIDGGTAMTYTGLDAKGKIMGGGISPGLCARFRSLSDYCGNLPSISFEEFNGLDELPAFATDTRTSMITSIFQEVGVHSRNIVKQFLKELRNRSDGATEESQKEPTLVSEKKPTIYVTGGDSGFLMRCLRKPDELPLAHLDIKEAKHLASYGIGHLINEKSKEAGEPTPEDALRLKLLGQRVAKQFTDPDIDGDLVYRGTIVSVSPGKKDMDDDLYKIRYDDGDGEEFTLDEVYDALKKYAQVGEKETASPRIWTKERRDDRKEGSESSAKQLLEEVPTLRATLEKKAEKVKAKAKAATVATAAASEVPEKAENATPNSVKRPRIAESSERQLGETKKAKQESTISQLPGQRYLGLRVAKYFPIENDEGELVDILYNGKVVSYEADFKFWHIEYSDGDEEDFDETELKKAIQLYIDEFQS